MKFSVSDSFRETSALADSHFLSLMFEIPRCLLP